MALEGEKALQENEVAIKARMTMDTRRRIMMTIAMAVAVAVAVKLKEEKSSCNVCYRLMKASIWLNRPNPSW